ncbi:ECF transporter S component [Eubacteriales bacterium KG127]
MTTIENKNMRNSGTYMLIINALFIALTLVATWLINIRLPLVGAGGLIHMGNVPMLIGAWLFGRKTGAISGAFGMALFDVMSGWASWAPFTFVIVGLMGYCAGLIEEKKLVKEPTLNRIVAVIVAIIIKVVGYYIAEGILYGNWIAPAGSIPGNIIQVGVAGIIVIIAIIPLKNIIKK